MESHGDTALRDAGFATQDASATSAERREYACAYRAKASRSHRVWSAGSSPGS
jgi:hypothetical protein